jgi:putative Holliday junction resolvase
VIERKNTEADLKAIIKLADEYQVKCLVVGMPYSLNGTSGRQAKQVQEFISKLAQFTDLPIETWDERLSTIAAEKALDEVAALGVSRKSKPSSSKKRPIDAVAAAVILQGYLERNLK